MTSNVSSGCSARAYRGAAQPRCRQSAAPKREYEAGTFPVRHWASDRTTGPFCTFGYRRPRSSHTAHGTFSSYPGSSARFTTNAACTEARAPARSRSSDLTRPVGLPARSCRQTAPTSTGPPATRARQTGRRRPDFDVELPIVEPASPRFPRSLPQSCRRLQREALDPVPGQTGVRRHRPTSAQTTVRSVRVAPTDAEASAPFRTCRRRPSCSPEARLDTPFSARACRVGVIPAGAANAVFSNSRRPPDV